MKNIPYRELLGEIIAALRRYGSVLVYIKGSPDPDALASALVVKMLCEMLSIKADIIASMEPSLAQNRDIIKKFRVPLKIEKNTERLTSYDAYAVVDYQSAEIPGLTGNIPCVLHLDHHEPVKQHIHADVRYIDEDAGSTSTIIALAFKEFNKTGYDEVLLKTGSLLVLGIQTDTDKTLHAGELDFAALSYLALYADRKLVDEIIGIPISEVTLAVLEKASRQKAVYRDWLIAGVGYIGEKDRDSIAITADYLLGSEQISTVAVFAIVEKKGGNGYTLDVSVRSRDGNFNMDFFIKEITATGGGRKYKGAFQINLDFFTYCPDKSMLWEMISKTVHNAIIKKRDELPIIELKGMYRKIKNKLSSIFRIIIMALISSLMICSWGCSKKYGMARSTQPVERFDIEIGKGRACALVRQRDFDIAASKLSEADWAKLLSMNQYQKKHGSDEIRLPGLNFFHIVLSNVGKSSLSISSVALRYGQKEAHELQKEEILRRCASPVYASIDLKKVVENKRYIGDKWCFLEMEYEKDVIGYSLPSIAPGETLIRIAVFDWIPVQHRMFSLVVTVKNEATGEEKTIDFPFERKEYRTKGKFFTRKGDKE